MNRFLPFIVIACLAGHAFAQPPNILWLSYEDSSPHLGCYGDPHARTPTIDKVATQAVRYTHAFTYAGVCAPSRSCIITGVYPCALGSQHMRSQAMLPDHIRPFPTYLREAGYYCTNNAKEDYNFKTPKGSWDESSNKAHWKNRKPGQPFFAVFNFTVSHESQFHGQRKLADIPGLDPAKLALPPYYPDTPAIRADWAQNYRSIASVDQLIAEKLKELDDAKLAEETIVFIWSDHGDGLPRSKRWLYDSGTHVPLIVRIPAKFRTGDQGAPGSVDKQLVSGIDFGPTVLNLAGVKIPAHMQGRAFLGANLTAPREYVYSARDRMDERYDIIRSVRDQRYRYVRNYEPWKSYGQFLDYNEKGAVAKEWRRLYEEGKLTGAAAAWFHPRKPKEELYDCDADPHEINNLAYKREMTDTLNRLRAAHEKWQEDILDLCLIPEPIMNELAKKHGSHWAILRNGDVKDAAGFIREVRAAATRYEGGASSLETVKAELANPSPIHRYWACVGMVQLNQWMRFKVDVRTPVEPLLKDASATVRVAAARALALDDLTELALPVLIAELKSEDPHVRLAAALALDEMDDAAKPAEGALREAMKADNSGGKYVDRVCARALAEMNWSK